MSDLSIDLIEKTREKLKEYEVLPVTRAQLTRDAFIYGAHIIPNTKLRFGLQKLESPCYEDY